MSKSDLSVNNTVKTEKAVQFNRHKMKNYLILAPNMLPIHFSIFSAIMKNYGYNIKILTNSGRSIVEAGQKYVHNDACYPALLVIGQMIDALKSGEYNLNETALIITQTGGGCRASNYISLLRKALKSADLGSIPVLSLNFSNFEKKYALKMSLPMILKVQYSIFYGDLIMHLKNQVAHYEVVKGSAEKLTQKWVDYISEEMAHNVSYKKIKLNYQSIIDEFASIEVKKSEKVKVGVVGEIYVKFSPVGNNNLERFLVNEGAEVRMGGLADFCLYCVYNGILDYKKYGVRHFKSIISKYLYNYFCKKQADINRLIEESSFAKMQTFKHAVTLLDGYIDTGVKMGEGYLLVAEILELIESGVNNIVCVQPFGCLPNHIIGKGIVNTIKERNPNVQLVAIDYDQSTSETNQQNRLKLMLSNAKDRISN